MGHENLLDVLGPADPKLGGARIKLLQHSLRSAETGSLSFSVSAHGDTLTGIDGTVYWHICRHRLNRRRRFERIFSLPAIRQGSTLLEKEVPMLALMLLLGCADTPAVDSGLDEPEWLYGTEEAECGEMLDARVMLPPLEDIRVDVWLCSESADGQELCAAANRLEWNTERGEIWVGCDSSDLDPSTAYAAVDWMAPNPAW